METPSSGRDGLDQFVLGQAGGMEFVLEGEDRAVGKALALSVGGSTVWAGQAVFLERLA